MARLSLVLIGFCLTALQTACQPQVIDRSPDSILKYIRGDGLAISLTETLGDTKTGERLFKARDGGHCILCHQVTALDAPFQGNVGPDLSTIASRLNPAQIRLRIVDYDRIKAGTTMPSYYRTSNLHQVQQDYEGKTVLSAQDIEDIIAYLGTLE